MGLLQMLDKMKDKTDPWAEDLYVFYSKRWNQFYLADQFMRIIDMGVRRDNGVSSRVFTVRGYVPASYVYVGKY